MEFLYEYGLFLAKAVTLVLAILLVVGGILATAGKHRPKKGELEVINLTEQLEDTEHHLQAALLDEDQLKKLEKEHKQKLKAEKKEKKEKNEKDERKKRLFVVEFKGSMDAHEVASLREEITAILSVIDKEYDEILVNLESPGGMVHGYGLAASQLQRIRDREIPLTVAVDKVAASGGYMMACVANNIISAPFAIIGSIGVIAQLPNFSKVLKKYDIDFEQHTAGEFKRTLTMLGENTEHAREKFREELEETHVLFKEFVSSNREQLDIAKVATGEHWYGKQALELGLVDKIETSDDYILNASKDADVFSVKYSQKKNIAEKFGVAAATGVQSLINSAWQKSTTWVK